MSSIDTPITAAATQARQQMASDSLVDIGALHKLENIADPRQRAEAVADQLEKSFMGMMMKAMRATVPEGGLLGEGLGGSTYLDMLDQHFVELGSMPRDPRFHETLVRQILQDPGQLDALNKMDERGA